MSHLSSNDYPSMDDFIRLDHNSTSTKQSRLMTIDKWLIHRPFIPIHSSNSPSFDPPIPSNPVSARQQFLQHLIPFGTTMPTIDPCKIIRVCMQNTQHNFKLYGDGLEMHNLQNHLITLGISLFAPISPNVNWQNHSNWSRARHIFRQAFKQVHLSASSSDVGKDPFYLNKHLIGGSAILTFGLWASKVSSLSNDTSGHGSFSITMIQGNDNKFVSFIAAYISVQKGSDIGTESVYAQQQTLYEKEMLMKGKLPNDKFCPRANAIKNLNSIIHQLQQQHHAIILMLDANQSSAECRSGSPIKPFSIEWLRLQRGMDDPFIQLMQSCPNSTTIHPNRDIDYVLTYGIKISNISTLAQNSPAASDHLGIVFDIDLASYFSSKYSDINLHPPRMLTSGNRSKFALEQTSHHKLDSRVQTLMDKISDSLYKFTNEDAQELNCIDDQLTNFMLAVERKCSRKYFQQQAWSPKQQEIARTYSYWCQKSMMEKKKLINWEHLTRLQHLTNVTDSDHLSLDPSLIYTQKSVTLTMAGMQEEKCPNLTQFSKRTGRTYGPKNVDN
jgi:hypothetical protein